MNIQQLLKEDREGFEKKTSTGVFGGHLRDDEVDWNEVYNWHKQSLIKFIDAEIERKRTWRDKLLFLKAEDNSLIDYIDEDIAHLQALKEVIEK